MAKQLAILLIVVSCSTLALSLTCINLKISGKRDGMNVTCVAPVVACTYHFVDDGKGGGSITQSCAEAGDEKDKDKCRDKSQPAKKIIDKEAFCDTDLCNTKEYFEKKCPPSPPGPGGGGGGDGGGGQAGLKSNLILAFCSISMYLIVSVKSSIFIH